MNNDNDFIDLDSTQNWSQLDVKKELDNLEVDEKTGKKYDFGRGFGSEPDKREEEILLDGLTSGLNYIPEEFLAAADKKHEEDRINGKNPAGADVSWAYRTKPDEGVSDDTSSFMPIADLKQAEEEAARLRAAEVSAVTEREEREKTDSIEALRKKNLEAQIAKHAQINASDAAVQANIEARKKAREEAAAAQEAIIRENARKREEERKQALEEMQTATDMFSGAALDLEEMDIPVVSKEERIAAAERSRRYGHEDEDIEEIEDTKASEDEEDEEETGKTKSKAKKVAAAPVKKKKKSAAEEYASWADDDYSESRDEDDDDEDEDEDEDYGDGFIGKIVAFFKNMSGLDILVAGTGILVVLVAIVTGMVYSSSQATKSKIAEFAPLGANMQTIGDMGSGQFLAIADARNTVPDVEDLEPVDEEEPQGYEEKDEDVTISVTMSLTSVKKDLKIKFINAKTKKLVANHEFKVNIEDANGKKYSATDDDMDGIIYLNSVAPGKTKVSMADLPDEKGITYSREVVTVTVKEKLDYKKIDVSDEIKSESEINANKEDTAGKLATEGTLTDTVEWVESTKTVAENGYVEVKKSSIPDPAKITPTVGATKTAKAYGATPMAISDSYYAGAFKGPMPYVLTRLASSNLDPNGDPNGGGGELSPEDIAATNAAATAAAEAAATVAAATAAAEATNAAATAAAGADAEATNAAATNAAATNAAGAEATNAVATNAAATNAAGAAATNAAATNAAATNGVNPTASAAAAATAGAGATATAKAKSSPQYDTTTQLRDSAGNELYIKNANGEYVKAAYADYYAKDIKFYRVSGEYKYTGWQTLEDGNTYYFNKDGIAVKGEQVIQGAKYNFDSTGALVKSSGTFGIDVSKWNGNINWTAVKNSGVSFVIIRCGYRGSSTGALVEDPTFKKNIKGATDAGLKVGVYFFSQAVSDVEAVEEASMTIDLIKKYKISYPVFLDVEDSGGRGDKIDANTRTAIIQAYCQTLKNSGYTPGVYANKSWLNGKMNAGSLSAYKIWLAQYNTEITYNGKVDMWQYSSKGSIGGIGGNTDLDISYLGY